MIELTDEQASVLRQGHAVRMFVPESVPTSPSSWRFNGNALIRFSKKTLEEIREKAALSKLGGRAAVSGMNLGLEP